VSGLSLRRALLALAAAGVAFGLVCVALTLASDHVDDRVLSAVLTALVGWSFVGTGVLLGGGGRATGRGC
jgi:hypothetical protein